MLALSTSVHVGLLYVALTATGVVRPPRMLQSAAEQVRFVEVAFRSMASPALRPSGRTEHRRRANAVPTFTLPPLLASLDLALPDSPPLPDFEPDYPPLELGGSTGLADDVLRLGLGTGASRLPAGALYQAYDELGVEKRVVPATANLKPHYPTRMLSRGIETNFSVHFVVDTSGSVDRETVELPPSVDKEFTSAVADALFKWRFVPAELNGRRVRQRVMQSFIFRLERRTGMMPPGIYGR